MHSHYFKLIIRLLARNPYITFANIACLSLGFTVFLILWQHSQSELDSEKFYTDYQKIVRAGVVWNWSDDGATWQQAKYGGLAAHQAPRLIEDFGDFESALEIYHQGNITSPIFGHSNDVYLSVINDRNERNRFAEERLAYADSNLFQFFNIPLIEGHPAHVLSEHHSAVLSQTTAKKLFGHLSPIGNVVYINDSIALHVTGIFKDFPSNTHLNFNLVVSTVGLGIENFHGFQLSHNYFKVNSNTDRVLLEAKLARFSDIYFGEMEKEHKGNLNVELFLQPLTDVPFSTLTSDRHSAKSKHFLIILSVLAVVILTMAWINHMNLTLTTSCRRYKEIAARKAVGARLNDFLQQFVTESVLVNLIAFFAALTIIQLTKPFLTRLLKFNIPPWQEINLDTWIIIFAAVSGAILLTGLYAGWVVTGFNPKTLFSGSGQSGLKNGISKILATVQYAAAIVLVAWVVSVNLQLVFLLRKDIGIKRDNVIIVDLPRNRGNDFQGSFNYFTTQLLSSPSIDDFTASASIMGDFHVQGFEMRYPEGANGIGIDSNGGVDERFIPFYGIKLLAGRNFLPDSPSDTTAIIISRIATQRLGFANPEDALGLELAAPRGRVIGVIEDYALRPFFKENASEIHSIRGIALTYGNTLLPHFSKQKISIRVSNGKGDDGMAIVSEIFKEAFPDEIFHSYFLDNHVNQYYTSEKIFLHQIYLFTAIAIVMACLGLLGVIRTKIQESTKEIGIRRIFGATVRHIAGILLKNTTQQVVIAICLAIPVAFYLVQQYLDKFSERITTSWWHYLLPVAILLFILLGSIGSILLKAASANPVESLRHE